MPRYSWTGRLVVMEKKVDVGAKMLSLAWGCAGELAEAHLDTSFDEGLDSRHMAVGGCFMEGRPAIVRCDVHIGSLGEEQVQDAPSPCTIAISQIWREAFNAWLRTACSCTVAWASMKLACSWWESPCRGCLAWRLNDTLAFLPSRSV